MSSKDEKIILSGYNNSVLYITILLIVIGLILFFCVFSTEKKLNIINEMNDSKYQ